ncbi:hypothetical protein L596_004934 [Steinernema carpocapsae]|uniref:Uncharacterized protein n=1 Tax=Steinernema carpocapsae TaxID=34508 RepID=A0A4U8UYV5_STECR|nr:hypothetical protein L596_004934 [Steinernema carpocapsae]
MNKLCVIEFRNEMYFINYSPLCRSSALETAAIRKDEAESEPTWTAFPGQLMTTKLAEHHKNSCRKACCQPRCIYDVDLTAAWQSTTKMDSFLKLRLNEPLLEGAILRCCCIALKLSAPLEDGSSTDLFDLQPRAEQRQQ